MKRSEATRRALTLGLAAGLLLQACASPSPPAFANKLWKVSRSSGVEPGTLYAFFADGTLLITSSHGTPAVGRWEYSGDTLTLVEEGLRHPAAIQRMVPDTFAITLRDGGTPLDITFVRESAP